jgi:hypothetical protein
VRRKSLIDGLLALGYKMQRSANYEIWHKPAGRLTLSGQPRTASSLC